MLSWLLNLSVIMDNFSQRRVDVATCWASNRISVMDTLEKYEDSYAILEEFKEWILNVGNDKEILSKYFLNIPKYNSNKLDKEYQD